MELVPHQLDLPYMLFDAPVAAGETKPDYQVGPALAVQVPAIQFVAFSKPPARRRGHGALRVLIVSADPSAQAALADALEDQGVEAEVADAGTDLVEAARVSASDVILVDIMPESAAVDRVGALVDEGAVVVLLLPDGESGERALAAGAAGVLSRGVDPTRLAAAVRATAAGLIVVDPEFDTARPAGRVRETPDPVIEELTPRELQVLQLLGEGLPNRTIAARLGISEHTAKSHVNAIISKLGAHTRTEAVSRAVRLGLIFL